MFTKVLKCHEVFFVLILKKFALNPEHCCLWNTWLCSFSLLFVSSFVFISLLCFVCIKVKAFIEVPTIYPLHISYTHLQVHPTHSCPSQPEPARCLQQTGTAIVFHTAGDAEGCLVACCNVSLWLSHAVTHSACMASFLSAELQQGHCPVCARHVCVSAFVHICHE